MNGHPLCTIRQLARSIALYECPRSRHPGQHEAAYAKYLRSLRDHRLNEMHLVPLAPGEKLDFELRVIYRENARTWAEFFCCMIREMPTYLLSDTFPSPPSDPVRGDFTLADLAAFAAGTHGDIVAADKAVIEAVRSGHLRTMLRDIDTLKSTATRAAAAHWLVATGHQLPPDLHDLRSAVAMAL